MPPFPAHLFLHVCAGADLLRSWFAGFLRSREIAEIDKVIQSEGGGGGGRASSQLEEGTERPLGPLQVLFLKFD